MLSLKQTNFDCGLLSNPIWFHDAGWWKTHQHFQWNNSSLWSHHISSLFWELLLTFLEQSNKEHLPRRSTLLCAKFVVRCQKVQEVSKIKKIFSIDMIYQNEWVILEYRRIHNSWKNLLTLYFLAISYPSWLSLDWRSIVNDGSYVPCITIGPPVSHTKLLPALALIQSQNVFISNPARFAAKFLC